ncbi:hypothetical protein ABZP36_027940 [Zizania latifolia]
MDVVEQLQGRRLLSNGAAAAAAAAEAEAVASPGPAGRGHGMRGGAARPAPFLSSMDATVITILSLLLCVLVVGLVLHAVVRCAFRVTRRVCYGQEPPGEEAESCAAPARKNKRGRGAIGEHPTLVYSPGIELAGYGSTECAICLAEFAEGERVRVLQRCSHGFHVRCIDRWLAAKQTCPTCRRESFAKPAAVQLQVDPDAGHQPEAP